MKNKVTVYAAVYIALVFLTGIFARYFKFLGASPEFFLVFLIAASMREGPHFGAIFGFASGIFADFVSVYLPGGHCLAYTTVGYFAGLLSGKFYANSFGNQAAVTVAAYFFVRAASWLAGETFALAYTPSFKWLFLTLVYDLAITPPAYAVAALVGKSAHKNR